MCGTKTLPDHHPSNGKKRDQDGGDETDLEERGPHEAFAGWASAAENADSAPKSEVGQRKQPTPHPHKQKRKRKQTRGGYWCDAAAGTVGT